ncbi:hypothetical protein DSO57_1015319 [Entomophthora muscae]|uniref:Uncharacterized protein n=1 Tax=Entomophthora muscae TaxID=34485 RepID=A0ACC2UE22_9FUNG|nr:hypothetical protein DSO57_1015319 [Entomophthora muscae]
MIYATKSYLTALKDQEVQLSDEAFASCPKIFNQLWVIHVEVEERVVPLIYFSMIETKQKSYVGALKIAKEDIQRVVLEEQEIRLTSTERPPKDPVG